MRVLFDQGVAVPLRILLEGHSVGTAAEESWDRLRNGEFLTAAEAARLDVFLTTDKNLRYQQNLTGRKIAVIVLSKQQWPDVRKHASRVIVAVNSAVAGSYVEVSIP